MAAKTHNTTTGNAVLVIENLSVSYGSRVAVDNVSFYCSKGRDIWLARAQWRGKDKHAERH